MHAVPDVPGVPAAEELSVLPAAELPARLAEAYRLIVELTPALRITPPHRSCHSKSLMLAEQLRTAGASGKFSTQKVLSART